MYCNIGELLELISTIQTYIKSARPFTIRSQLLQNHAAYVCLALNVIECIRSLIGWNITLKYINKWWVVSSLQTNFVRVELDSF